MAKILVTGGAGYIGSHMVRRLLKNNYEPVILDNLVYGHKESIPYGVLFFEGDIADENLLHKIFTENEIKAVMHFSAYAYVGESVENPRKYFENNFVKTIAFTNAMVDHKVNNFIFSSTCAVYGETDQSRINEDHPQNPINPYGFTKFAVERVLRDYDRAYGLKFMSLRYFNAAGADDGGEIGESHNPETHLIPLAMRAIIDPNYEFKVFGDDYPTPDGTCIRDYIHVNDLADAHLLALGYLFENQQSDFFNLGTESGFSVKQIVDMCEWMSGKKVKREIIGRRPGDPQVLVADAAKAKKVLNWQPKYNLENIIKTAWEWEKNKKY